MNINEILNDCWYHGSFDEIREFLPFSHLGTCNAAQDRIEKKRYEDSNLRDKDAFIYECKLDVLPVQVLEIKEDWGSHRAQSLARALKDRFPHMEEYKALWRNIQEVQKKDGKVEANRFGYPELQKTLINKGYRLIYYKNMVEDYGELSLSVIDPKAILFTKLNEEQLA